MFRDDRSPESTAGAWQPFQTQSRVAAAIARPPTVESTGTPDEVGAVWHVYREIARRIPRNAYTRHASTLGGALR